MRRELVASFGIVVGLLMICVPAFAHHGGSDYDTIHLKTLKGTVTEFLWENPHCQVFFDVNEVKAGNAVHWGIETLAPGVLKRAGWSPKTLQPGDQITVTFAPSRKGTPVGLIRKVILPDGTMLTGGSIAGSDPLPIE
jgi:Family of unknown function (DUF6152)